MNYQYIIYILGSILLFSCASNKTEIFKQRQPLDETESVILTFPTKNINLKGYIPYEECCYDEHIFIGEKIEIIAQVMLSDNPRKTREPISYKRLENISRALGGNYVLVKDLKISPFTFKFSKITFDVFYVEDTKGLEKYYIWTPSRKLVGNDFKGSNKSKKGIFLEQNYIDIEVNETYTKVAFTFYNKFYKSHFSCVGCDSVDLTRENLKFDLIELYLRYQTQSISEANKVKPKYFSDFLPLRSELHYPYLIKLRKKIDGIDKIDNIETLNFLQLDVSKKINELAKFSAKSFIVLNMKKPKA